MSKFEKTLPSEHQKERVDEQKRDAERLDEAKRQEARRKAAFDWLLQQENGRIVWAWFFHRCGYNRPTLMRTAAGDVAPLSTECLSAIRNVYLEARKEISAPELLAKAEFEAEYGVAIAKPAEKEGDKK